MDPIYPPSFRRMMNEVVAAGGCAECGSCVLACPHKVIRYVDGKPAKVAGQSAAFDHCGVSETMGCDVCAAVCPRLWPREAHLRDATFGADRPYEGIFGVYHHIFVARARQSEDLDRAQDGGIVTALLAWAREAGRIDAAVVAAVGEGDDPCFPTPKVASTVEQIRAAAGSWYTYCPNNLALEGLEKPGLERAAFVGVPCQITPLRKMQVTDPSILLKTRKKPQVVARQRGFLRGFGERVAFSVGLFCTEVFRRELMTERVEQRMGITLADVSKVNVKGEILIHTKSGSVEKIPLEEAMEQYQRPVCRHCTDFSAEMADIACGGVGTDRATIVVLRTRRGVDLWRDFEASGRVEVWPIQENRKAWNILLRLARKQRERVPPATPDGGGAAHVPQYSAREAAARAVDVIVQAGRPAAEIEACLDAAYAGAPRPAASAEYAVGAPIPGDPGEPAPGEKRKLPPPPSPAQGGASPGWRSCAAEGTTNGPGSAALAPARQSLV